MAEAEANPTEKETTRVRSIAFCVCAFSFFRVFVCAAFCVRAQSACLVMGHDEDRLLPHFRGVFVQNTLSAFQCLTNHAIFFYIYIYISAGAATFSLRRYAYHLKSIRDSQPPDVVFYGGAPDPAAGVVVHSNLEISHFLPLARGEFRRGALVTARRRGG